MNEYLECGQVVNTHGIRGEVRIVPWADSPEFLCRLKTLYLDGKPMEVKSCRVHKGSNIVQFAGIETVEAAMQLRDKVVSLRRSDVHLPEGRYFLADLIGIKVIDEDGKELGTLEEILTPSAQNIYLVRGEREILIPAVPEFVLDVDIASRTMKVHLIEGM